MSFRDVPIVSSAHATTLHGAKRRAILPRVILQEPSSSDEEEPIMSDNGYSFHERYNQPFILHSHGRNSKDTSFDDADPFLSIRALLHDESDCFLVSKSQNQLIYKLDDLQKLVNDLDVCLREAQTPETAWRFKILGRTAKDADQELWQNMQDGYRAAKQKGDKSAQDTIRMILRDWARIHKTLLATLRSKGADSMVRMRTDDSDKCRPRRISKSPNASPERSDDYFDKVSRQADIDKVQEKMHIVHDIYRDLALLVDQQQDHIDTLNDNVVDAKIMAEAAVDEVACYATRNNFVDDPCGAMTTSADRITLDDDDDGEMDWYESFISYFDCQSLVAPFQPQEKVYEVEVICENDDSAVEIQHVYPPIQDNAPPPTTTPWLNHLQTLPGDIVSIGTSLLEYESPMACHASQSAEIKLW
ncbi:hypothetical protein MPSEU_000663600 [Mayamaea pseudoterrestris]|nr:hypothetical protein MPSEU_000663600 [Mayamaea pseudoterrestris]